MEKERNDIISQLLSDDLFIQWIVNPTSETDSYWQRKIESDFELGENIKILKKILDNLRIEEPSLSTTQRQEIWNKIEKTTIKRSGAKLFLKRRNWLKIASAVAVATVITVNICVLVFRDVNEKPGEIDYMSVLRGSEGNIDLAKSDVTLVLSDNRQMNVQTDSTEVVYDKEGKLKVNAEEIVSERDKKDEINQLIVPYRKVVSLTLSDGTKVWVNSGSRLAYISVFDENKREVFLMGEAYFDVTKDDNRPFIIKTDQLDVMVRGTTLNVSAYENEPLQTVALVSGKVDVSNKGGNTTYKMEPNQLFSFDLSVKEADIKDVDVSEYISWMDGYLLLQNESLDRLFAKINRHYNIRIHYNKEEMQKIKVSGKLDLQKDIHKVFQYISATAPVTYEIENDVTVKSK